MISICSKSKVTMPKRSQWCLFGFFISIFEPQFSFSFNRLNLVNQWPRKIKLMKYEDNYYSITSFLPIICDHLICVHAISNFWLYLIVFWSFYFASVLARNIHQSRCIVGRFRVLETNCLLSNWRDFSKFWLVLEVFTLSVFNVFEIVFDISLLSLRVCFKQFHVTVPFLYPLKHY